MGRKVIVFCYGKQAGILRENNDEYVFTYDDEYRGKPISLSLPLSKKTFPSKGLHPFFKTLAPEGWLKKRYSELQHIDERDLFGFLIRNGSDLLGAITFLEVND